MTPFLLGAHLRFDERGDKARHRRFEIAGAAHEMDRGYFRLILPGEFGSIRSRSASPGCRQQGPSGHVDVLPSGGNDGSGPHMPAKVQAAPWLTTGWAIAQSGTASDPSTDMPTLRCARETGSESVRFWSGVTRSMKSGARVSQARMDAIFLPHARSRGRTDCCPFNDQHRVVGCNQFQHAIPRPVRL